MSFWYLSFVKDGHFSGACVVQGDELADAIRTAWRLEINPGGEVLGVPLDKARETILPHNILFNREQLEALGFTRLGDLPPGKYPQRLQNN